MFMTKQRNSPNLIIMCIVRIKAIVRIAIDRKSFILLPLCLYKSIVLIYVYTYKIKRVVLSTLIFIIFSNNMI